MSGPAPSGPWLVTGARGMLGRDLLAKLASRSVAAVATDTRTLDITDARAVAETLRVVRPSVVVNCAAWTAVDDAETAEASALRVNGDGPANLARACADVGARLLQVSTDYVFGGDSAVPYAEDASPAPASAYGRTKLAGERAVLSTLPDLGYVVRTAWLYGAHGQNFVRTMVRLEAERETVDVVDDQAGQPTWTADLARLLADLGGCAAAPPGVYHGTSAGRTTWCGLARAVFAGVGADPSRVRPTTTDRFPRPAPRPASSVLAHDRWAGTGIAPIRPWDSALAAALPSLLAAWRG